ncbi:MAG: hydroxyacylglutathione hydrolase [Alphaproteobacteria bacterium]|jgi:hydroxyacylglutathione hydrolase|nr:hydroxyacylglutathione hydrolase [Alphaproteobacteria bacterium]
MLEIHQFPCLNDNYGFLVHDRDSGETAAIDTPDAGKYLAEARSKGWTLTQIWNTHWHPDHAGGNEAIKAETGCTVTAPAGEAGKIAAIDRTVGGGDTVSLGRFTAEVIDVPGHTLGHIAYYIPAAGVAFVGDALFALGCGRLFEGDAKMMWTSLNRLKALPADTTLYCAHEYTAANARFAVSVDPANEALAAYARDVEAARARGEWTVPTVLERELAANPFLRADDPGLQAAMGHPGDAVATFAEVRQRKDNF